ncbi:tRNA preQ1(34) S-adenosylmethionine ribosyltransferase-isomerase QueA [Basilea psittacipulmonis]|uniref:tRNA preQ1(34) S-adenosylmethionine ribosyltransferase-isomerase QueA n=1 Tax=Basilea psittacipulmonis TaxID=1472345 RepID=UPI0013906318|nr:tRNA preQ1(34) S-adenosylmethionine ribosyltransferase-isomerase QueA [Basilea psittacipulmonis]
MNPQLKLSDFDYPLPEALIAQHPASERKGSRLLWIDSKRECHDQQFSDLLKLLKPHDLLVFNNTKVIKARLFGQKESGGKVECLVERILTENRVLAHLKASKAPKTGTQLIFESEIKALVLGRQDSLFELQFPDQVLGLLDRYGHLPLPPYITHQADAHDDQRYQTVYAQKLGAVAAPTAGLHFDTEMIQALSSRGIQHTFVTLHVGAGTFQPVRVNDIKDHVMHSEWYEVSKEAQDAVLTCRQNGGRVIAVGTTSVRALESAATQGGVIEGKRCPIAHCDDTRLFITPGYEFKVIDGLITNFHLPQSTLLMLVSALMGIDTMKQAYAHAIEKQYRFFSYGDAMFIEPK